MCRVTVGDRVAGEIAGGLLVLLGVSKDDSESDARAMADRTSNLRIFPDEEGRMNYSAIQAGKEMMVVSQFTLLGDCRKGRRPNFTGAAPPDRAMMLYDVFIEALGETGLKVSSGEFGEMMEVELVNSGPVTLILDSRE